MANDRRPARRHGQSRVSAARRRRAFFRLESLEERCVPASFVMTGFTEAELRQAIVASNATPEPDTITYPQEIFRLSDFFTQVNTVNLSGSQLPTVTGALTIVANPSQFTPGFKISAAVVSRIFQVAPNGNLTIVNATLENGKVAGDGGAILNQGSLRLDNVVVRQSRATRGGGIFSSGPSLILNNTTITNNLAIGADAGLITSPTQFQVGGEAAGGGLAVNGGSVTITNSSITSNRAQGGRGGNGSNGVDSGNYQFRAADGQNGLPGATGGAGINAQSGGAAKGGGVWLGQGSLRVVSSTISDNSVLGGTGGNGGNGGRGGNGQDGGWAPPITFISANAGNGGKGGTGGAAGAGGLGGSAQGGGVFATGAAGTIDILNSTVAKNDATGGSGGGGGVGGKGGDGGRAGLSPEDTLTGFKQSGGQGGTGGQGGDAGASGLAYGGAAFFEGSDALSRFVNVTIASNQVATSAPVTPGAGGAGGAGGFAIDEFSVAGAAGVAGATGASASASATEGGGIGFLPFVRAKLPLILYNTIVAANTSGTSTPSDIFGTLDSPSSSLSNLIGTGGAGGLVDGVLSNKVGVADPGLLPLGNNGGPTQTIQLKTDSAALDGGETVIAQLFGLSTDQRGVTRYVGDRVDIGAVEVAPSYVVTTLTDEDNGTTDPGVGSGTSLREAINLANLKGTASAPQTITFAAGLLGTINLTRTLPSLASTFIIQGPSDGELIVRRDTGGDYPVFSIEAAANIVLDGLTITNGKFNLNGGGGVYSLGVVEIRNCLITGNLTTWPNGLAGGGGVFNAGTLTMVNSTVVDNTAGYYGGGVYNHRNAKATILNSTIANNRVLDPNGLAGNLGSEGTLELSNSIVTGGNARVAPNMFARFGGPFTIKNLVGGDAKLGPLQDNGSGRRTMALLPGSPAINAGDNSLVPADLTTDARGTGYTRIRGGKVDLGAFEIQGEPPTITRAVASLSTNEGTQVTNQGTFDDLQGRSTVTLTASVGTVTRNNATGAWNWTYTPPDNTAAPTTVTITATDDIGLTAAVTFTLAVANVTPTASITGGPAAGSSPEGTAIALGSSISDPGLSDRNAGFVYAWSVTKDGVAYASAATAGFTFTPDDDATYVVTLTARDKDGATSPAVTRTITVTNVAPTIAVSGARSIAAGSLYTLTLGAVNDPGTDTVSQYIVHWGDGTSDTYTTPGDKTHVYNGVGTTRIPRVDLVDEDGTYTDVGSQFLAPVASAAGSNASHLASGDFNKDGRLDLVVSNNGTSDDTVRILMGLAGGGFAAPVAYQTGLGPNDVVVADFNGDGAPDIAASNAYTQDVAILLNRGNGTFAPAMTYGIFGSPVDLAVADFDRDGSPDLAVAALGSDQVHVLLNDGAGGFWVAGSYDVQAISLLAVAAGDFNGDGSPDIAAVGGTSETLSILTNDGGGGFSLTDYQSTGALPVGLAVADLDGDRAVDLAIAEYGGSAVSIYRNVGGALRFANRLGVGGSPSSIAIGDLDNDGAPDLAVAGGAVVSILRNAGSGAFRPAVDYNAGGANVVAIGDFDRDGAPDLVATNPDAGTVGLLSRRTVVITKAAPSAVLTAPATASEGQSFTVSLDGPAAGLSYSFGTSVDGVTWVDDAFGTSTSRTLTFPDNGTFYVRGRVIDSDGAVGVAVRAVLVKNVDPTITAFNVPAGPVVAGASVSLDAAATDPAGALDPLTFTWTLTDPNGTVRTLHGPSVGFTPTIAGSWGIALTVTDGDGGSSTKSTTLTVNALQVTQVSARVGSTWVNLDPASARPLPWASLRSFRLAFNGDPSRVTLADLALSGVRFGNYLAGASISVDAASSSVTVTVSDAAAIGSDAWAARVGKAGDRLTLAFGGVGITFNVLPGDINGDGVVNLMDVSAVQLAMRPGSLYNPFADLNGDGVVDSADLAIARRWAGSKLL